MLEHFETSIFENLEKSQLILHFADTKGNWDSNISSEISERWENPEKLFGSYEKYDIGVCDFSVTDEEEVAVGTMVVKSNNNVIITALRRALKQVALFCIDCEVDIIKIKKNNELNYKWEVIEKVLEEELVKGCESEGYSACGYDFDLEIYE